MEGFIYLQRLGIKKTLKLLFAETIRSNMPAVTYRHCGVTKHKIPEERSSNTHRDCSLNSRTLFIVIGAALHLTVSCYNV